MSEDDCLVSFVDLCLAEHFDEERRAIHKEYSWEATDGVPNVGRYGLHRGNDNNILLLALEVLCSEWQDEMHD